MTCETNSAVTTILARCLLEPEFHRKLSQDPKGTLRGSGLSREVCSSFSEFEFAKLQLFGGLITQTQHNFLWETFPLSRALLKHYGMEVSIFSSYRQRTGLAQRVGLSRSEKIRQFVGYLREFLKDTPNTQSCPGLLDVLTHESICWDLQETSPSLYANIDTLVIPQGARKFDRFVPSIPKTVRLAQYKYDPLEIGSALDRKVFEPSRLKLRRARLFYRMDPTTYELAVFKVTSAAWQLFMKLDGNRTVGSILTGMTSKRPRREMRGYLQSAYERGLIELR